MQILKGDIFYVKTFGRVQGSEQAADRPAVVVSNNVGNMHSNICEVVYLTGKEKKPLPTHVSVMARVPSTALCEQIDSISQDRLCEYIRSCTDEEMAAIDRALMISLGIAEKDGHAPNQPQTFLEGTLSAQLENLQTKMEKLNAENAGLTLENGDLKELLRNAEKQINEAHVYIEQLQADRTALQDRVESGTGTDMVKLMTERDLYKSLYEQAFERIIAR